MWTGIIVRSCGTRLQSMIFGRIIISSNLPSTHLSRKSGPYLEYDPKKDVKHLRNRATSGKQTDMLHFSRYGRLSARVIPEIFPFVVKSDGTRLKTA